MSPLTILVRGKLKPLGKKLGELLIHPILTTRLHYFSEPILSQQEVQGSGRLLGLGQTAVLPGLDRP